MNLEMLHAFRYVAKYKNLTSAAQHLYVSQPTLSRQMMALEAELGVKLFERNNKQMQLTRAGEVFYQESENLAKHMQTMLTNVHAAGQGQTGLLRLTLPMALYELLLKPLAAMKENYPQVQVLAERYNFDEIPNAVHHNLYDAGISYDFSAFHDEIGEFDDLAVVPLRKERFCLVVPSCYEGQTAAELMPKITQELPLITPSHSEPPFMKSLLAILQQYAGTKITRTQNINTTDSMIMNVACGLGYGIVPHSWRCFFQELRGMAFVDISEAEELTSNVVLLYKREGATQVTENFVRLVEGIYA